MSQHCWHQSKAPACLAFEPSAPRRQPTTSRGEVPPEAKVPTMVTCSGRSFLGQWVEEPVVPPLLRPGAKLAAKVSLGAVRGLGTRCGT